jgi:hypothetical protein
MKPHAFRAFTTQSFELPHEERCCRRPEVRSAAQSLLPGFLITRDRPDSSTGARRARASEIRHANAELTRRTASQNFAPLSPQSAVQRNPCFRAPARQPAGRVGCAASCAVSGAAMNKYSSWLRGGRFLRAWNATFSHASTCAALCKHLVELFPFWMEGQQGRPRLLH